MAWAERRRALLFYGFIGAIAAVLLAIYLIRSLNEPSVVVERADTTNSTAAPSALIKSDSTISALKPNTAATTDTTSMVELKIMAVDTCYLKLESRDSLVYDKTIWPGNVVEFSLPQPIRLTMGNAPGIELVVDGVKLPAFPSSRRNQVVRLGSGGIIN